MVAIERDQRPCAQRVQVRVARAQFCWPVFSAVAVLWRGLHINHVIFSHFLFGASPQATSPYTHTHTPARRAPRVAGGGWSACARTVKPCIEFCVNKSICSLCLFYLCVVSVCGLGSVPRARGRLGGWRMLPVLTVVISLLVSTKGNKAFVLVKTT